MNRTFNLLGLIYSQGDVAAVRHALKDRDVRDAIARHRVSRQPARGRRAQARDAAGRGHAGRGAHPQGQRHLSRRARATSRTRSRSCCTTRTSRSRQRRCCSSKKRGLWSLADDLEHVLAHRDVRDQHVFEAASWALAANRVKAGTAQGAVAGSRCRRWSSPIGCAACRCSTSPTSTSCSGWRGWAARSATKRAARSTSAAKRSASIQFLLDGRVTVNGPDGKHDIDGAGGARLRGAARRIADARRRSSPPIARSRCR